MLVTTGNRGLKTRHICKCKILHMIYINHETIHFYHRTLRFIVQVYPLNIVWDNFHTNIIFIPILGMKRLDRYYCRNGKDFMMKQVIFVGSTSYSGSTFFDMTLGNDPTGFSCGEVYAFFHPFRPHHRPLNVAVAK